MYLHNKKEYTDLLEMSTVFLKEVCSGVYEVEKDHSPEAYCEFVDSKVVANYLNEYLTVIQRLDDSLISSYSHLGGSVGREF
ncbi:hypothetical protein PQ478_08890 [Alkalihalophilus pseudofirmus]|uniref:hypothetical protein n=1 Tax=Alkalihalophilus pseudofirmus TaxID=79885 RepID=UPI00259B8827|nr:hypothetical protein [Alkalihalophilus pseudofirmus]WEG18586.1 hypothetical protein PQ478_08890 [Alkalihalophilus pseudofirmus]